MLKLNIIFLVRLILFSTTFIFLNPTFSAALTKCEKLQNQLNQFRIQNKVIGMGLYYSSEKNTNACYLFSGSTTRDGLNIITQHNLFQIGSITKSYFSAILLQLEAESQAGKIPFKFNINQKLKQWLPQYPKWGNVTIKQLLNMTSGIYSYTELPNLPKLVLSSPEKIWSSKEILQLAYQHKPNTYFAPGKGWHYSDTNYVIAGQIIEKVYQKYTGHSVSLRTILTQRILKKLKLNNTFYYTAELPEPLLTRMVHGYNFYTKRDITPFNLSIAGSAGAIISNPKDVANWITALFSGKVLPNKQLEEMLSLVSEKTGQPIMLRDTSSVSGYALGLVAHYSKKAGPIWWYQGGTFGYTSNFMYLPKQHVIISLIANQGAPNGIPIHFGRFINKMLRTVLLPKVYFSTTDKKKTNPLN